MDIDATYEWDNAKAELNRQKHGLHFDVVLGFDWATTVVGLDERYDYGEPRYRAFGRLNGRPVCIAFTQRDGNIRIISVRQMHEKEGKRYGI